MCVCVGGGILEPSEVWRSYLDIENLKHISIFLRQRRNHSGNFKYIVGNIKLYLMRAGRSNWRLKWMSMGIPQEFKTTDTRMNLKKAKIWNRLFVWMLHTHPGGFQISTGDLNRPCNFNNEDSHTLNLLYQWSPGVHSIDKLSGYFEWTRAGEIRNSCPKRLTCHLATKATLNDVLWKPKRASIQINK